MHKRGQDKKEKWLSLFFFFIFVVLLSVLLYQNQSFKISPHNHGHFFRQVWIKKTRVQRSQARMWSSKNVPSAIRLSPHFLQDSLFTHSLGTHGKLFTVFISWKLTCSVLSLPHDPGTPLWFLALLVTSFFFWSFQGHTCDI